MISNFNNDWQFSKEGQAPLLVNLPHDAMISEARYAECRSGNDGAYFAGGEYQYTKEFILEESDINKYVALLFEGVYQDVTVKVNNIVVGTHKNGYTEFRVDISQAVQVGVNIVEVLVNNSLVPNCRWYSGSGIYRPVSLIIKDKVHIEEVVIKTLSYNPAVIEVSASATSDIELEVEIKSGEEVIAKGKPGKFLINYAKLWSSEHPHLYTCTVKCLSDEVVERFGIRLIEYSSRTGLLINGDETLLRGGCIHHDNGVLGACAFKDAEYRRIKILKENGFNAVRISHNPASRAILEACDELGMYVMDESFDGWYIPKNYHDYSRIFWSEYKNDLLSMVKKDLNHPSVIMYSIGNEVSETASKEGVKLAREMTDFVKSIDATRPVTVGINVLLNVYAQLGLGVYKDKKAYVAERLPEEKGYKDKKAGSSFFNALTARLGKILFFISGGRRADKIVRAISASVDIIGLNYASSRYDKDAKKYKERVMVGAETMAADLPYNWERVKRHKALIGDFVWAAWDYLGEACFGDWTYHSYKGLPLLAGQGMIDITGKPLASMAFLQTVWGMRDKPYIAVRPLNHAGEVPSKGAWQFTNALDSWSWHGYEGIKTVVEVYSEAYAVRLELNGKVIKTKKLKKFKALFNVNYEPGTITAVSLNKEGKEISRFSLFTAEKEVKLNVKVDKTTLIANNQDLAFLEIEFSDNNGNLLPYIEKRVEIEVEGESVTLQGFGSALCKSDEIFNKTYHDTYRGRSLAVLRATEKSGLTKIIIKADNVACRTLTLEVK